MRRVLALTLCILFALFILMGTVHMLAHDHSHHHHPLDLDEHRPAGEVCTVCQVLKDFAERAARSLGAAEVTVFAFVTALLMAAAVTAPPCLAMTPVRLKVKMTD